MMIVVLAGDYSEVVRWATARFPYLRGPALERSGIIWSGVGKEAEKLLRLEPNQLVVQLPGFFNQSALDRKMVLDIVKNRDMVHVRIP